MRPDTDCAALLRAYVRAWPAWLGGYEESRRWGFKFHTQSQRSGDLGSKHGFPVVSQRREGETFHEYRLASQVLYFHAQLQVKSWATGIDVATLEAQESLRPVQAGLFAGGA